MKNKPHSWICHAEFSLNYFSTYAEFHKNLSKTHGSVRPKMIKIWLQFMTSSIGEFAFF